MFGEMVGVWLLTAFKNFEKVDRPKSRGYTEDKKSKNAQNKDNQTEDRTRSQKTINLVEIGPGTGIMMCDILRTL